jgi:double-stranded uracil-DNA glycosylase
MTRKHAFPPIIGDTPKLLILGTLPGEESLSQQRYYAHPRNHFWPLMAALLNVPLPDTYEQRCTLLISNSIAVWDVLASAERAGSLDSALKNEKPNAIAELLREHTSLAHIAFNGQAASQLFCRHITPKLGTRATTLALITLTSSSPTNVRPFEAKLENWHAGLAPLSPFLRGED